jgi:signal transduction histidine kinase/DNA-binding NarL/FixJ family response regulator
MTTSDLINLLREADSQSRKSVSESEKLYCTVVERSRQFNHQPCLAEGLAGLAYCEIAKGDLPSAEAHLNESLAIYRTIDDKQGEINAIYTRGILAERQGDLTLAETAYQKAFSESERYGYQKGKARALSGLANVRGRRGDYAASLNCFLKSLTINEALGDELAVAQSLSGIAIVYQRLDDYPHAIEATYKAALAYERLESTDNLQRALSNLGILQTRAGKYSDALQALERVLSEAKSNQKTLLEATTLNNIADIHIKQNKFEQALSKIDESLSLQQNLDAPWLYANTLHTKGEVYLMFEQYAEAEIAFRRSLEIASKIDDRENILLCYLGLAKVAKCQSRWSDATKALDQATVLAESLNEKKWLAEAYSCRATLLEKQGKSDEALDAFRKFYSIERDIMNREAEKRMQSLTVQYQVEQAKQQTEIERLKNIELADALKKVEEANAFKTELLGIAAHDLKNPLQVIMGFASLIQEVKTLDEAQSNARAIERSSERMLKLIKDLLETATLDSGKLELSKTPVNVAKLLRTVAEHNRPNAEKKSQTISLDLDETAVADLDLERMREVFENLISNAVKYSPVGKRIQVRLVRTSETSVQIAVKDEGQGLTEADKEKLFGKFQRLSARPTGGESSTGLGLSIVKQLVELHGGTVRAESEGKGKGATFFVELPALKPTSTLAPHRRERQPKPAMRNRVEQSRVQTIRVGIIEDNLDLLHELEARLKRDEKLACVGAFESAEMALALLEEVDVILMDIGLPGISGIDAIQQVKAKFPSAKIIMLTVQDDDKHISRAIIAGAHGYLTKKTSITKIFEYVEEAVVKGGMMLSSDVARRVSDLYLKFAPKEESTTALTSRETQILKLISDGKSLKEIAQSLRTSVNTVRNQVAKIYDKLHSHSKSEAVSKALKSGLI